MRSSQSAAKEKALRLFYLKAFGAFGSPSWTRTNDLRINRAFNFECSFPTFEEFIRE
jgi:hypothetical protein